jgi:hypothetical protein
MAKEAPLKPVFLPSLAQGLADAENAKGSALTEAEAHRLRDEAACIMMSTDEARQMDQSRGYRDVNPENCLADWHRIRGEFAGLGFLPELILCLPGSDHFREQCEPLLQQAEVKHEFRGHDPRMAAAFEASRSNINPSLYPRDFEDIARHSTVLYVLSESYAPGEAAAMSRDFLRLGRQLLDAGGIAIKCESSGVAHSASYWRELAERAEASASLSSPPTTDLWQALYTAYVQLPIQSETDFYSCGMHLLGHPDMIASCALMDELLTVGQSPAIRAVDLFDGFGAYLLSEIGNEGFISSHTFSLNAESKRYRVIWEPCTGYDEDNFFFNPYGRWRFVNP